MTVLDADADCPLESETVYVTLYVPTTAVFTVVVLAILKVILPSSGSEAVAPASTYVPPCTIVAGFGGRTVIVGGWSVGGTGGTGAGGITGSVTVKDNGVLAQRKIPLAFSTTK